MGGKGLFLLWVFVSFAENELLLLVEVGHFTLLSSVT